MESTGYCYGSELIEWNKSFFTKTSGPEWTGPFGTQTKFCFAVFVAVTFFCRLFVVEMIVKKET